jgi:hypothetical protein
MSNGGNGSLNKSFRATPAPASIWQTPTTFLRPRNMAGASSPTINGFSPEPAVATSLNGAAPTTLAKSLDLN